jgi:hypothetical protein
MTTVFNARALTWALTVMAAFASFPAQGVDRLYFFVDEWGVAHFSNVPGDPRYRPVRWAEDPAAPQPGPVSVPAPLSVLEEVPRVVRPGVPVPVTAKESAEPAIAGPVPEDVTIQDTFTDETLTPDVALEPPDSGIETRER